MYIGPVQYNLFGLIQQTVEKQLTIISGSKNLYKKRSSGDILKILKPPYIMGQKKRELKIIKNDV